MDDGRWTWTIYTAIDDDASDDDVVKTTAGGVSDFFGSRSFFDFIRLSVFMLFGVDG